MVYGIARGASSAPTCNRIASGLIIALIAAILWKGAIKPADITFPAANEITFFPAVCRHGDHVLGICEVRAFTHLSSEFKNPERDFPSALIIGLMLAGSIVDLYRRGAAFWRLPATDSGLAQPRLPLVVVHLFGIRALWVACIIDYLTCFCQPECVCSEFCASIWTQMQYQPDHYLAQLSPRRLPCTR